MKKKKRKSFVEKYNEKETKGNAQNTALKSTVDTIASSFIGTGLGAISGKFSPLVGIAAIVAGHYLGDKSGLLRITGASTLGYGIAKAKDYNENPEYDSPKKRFTGLGNDFLAVAHLNWLKKKAQEDDQAKKEVVQQLESQVAEKADEKEVEHITDAEPKSEGPLENVMQIDDENQEEKEIDPFDDPATDLSLI